MRRLLLVLSALILAACVGNPPRPDAVLRHDLGDPVDRAADATPPLARVEVRAARWLETAAQQYRLVYREPQTRFAYAAHRWVAAPGELLENWLERSFRAGAGNCRLVVWLDELEQRFATPQSSQVAIAVRVALLPARSEAPLGAQTFRIVETAPTPDAFGGAVATRSAAAALVAALNRWFDALARNPPGALAACQ